MKRIKSLNGYTIYEVTERDAKHDASKTAGEYEIYFSSDIRDYGLSNSYAEFDGIDNLNVAMELCSGNTAIAKEICESVSTCVDSADIEKVEKMLDDGATVDEITEKLETGSVTRIYNGYIHICDADTIHENGLHLIPALHKYKFCACGTVGDLLTYLICDSNGDYIPEFEHVQFIRAKSGGKYHFLINSID